MTTPAGWVKDLGNIYSNTTFNVNSVNYLMKVNSSTGAMDLYVQSSTGDILFATSGAGNNLTLIDNNDSKNAFVNSLPPNQRSGLTSSDAINNYIATKFSLPANTYRANLINSIIPNANSTFPTMPGVGTAQGPSPVSPPISLPSTGGLGNIVSTALDILKDPFSGAQGITFENPSEDQLFKSFGVLKYPEDLLEKHQDTLVIEQFKYEPPNGSFLTQSLSQIVIGGLTRTQYLTKQLGTVILPIPQGIMDSNNVDWGGNELGNLPAAAVSAVAQNLPRYAAATALGGLAGAATGTGAGQGASIGAGIELNKELLGVLGQSGPLKTIFGAGLISSVAGQAGYEVSPESLLSRGFGIAPNSNLELLFNGPTLRSFQFVFRMSPRSEEEGKKIRNIIRFFKQGMSPRKQTPSSGSTASFFLGTPNIFKLKYTYNGTNQIKGLNKFKNCALTGFSVNYAPDGKWASYGGSNPGQPVSVLITMAFNELDPVYNTDYNDSGNDEVGF